jgi:transposase InsO family protein
MSSLIIAKFNDFGELTGDMEYDIDVLLLEVHSIRVANDREVTKQKPKFEALRPNFGWISVERLKKTLAATTQYARAIGRIPFRMHYKTRFPAANVRRFNDDVATDTFFADTPAIDDGIRGHGGCMMAQIFCGKKTQLTAAYPMKSESEMPATLQEFIRKEGAPNLLFSDNAKVQIGAAVNAILRHYGIDDHQSESYHQHQNYAERRIQEIKRFVDVLMDRTGTPAGYWLLCLLYAVYLLNRLACESLGGISAIQAAHNWIPDVSALLGFHWWQEVYYSVNDDSSGFPSKSKEKLGSEDGSV